MEAIIELLLAKDYLFIFWMVVLIFITIFNYDWQDPFLLIMVLLEGISKEVILCAFFILIMVFGYSGIIGQRCVFNLPAEAMYSGHKFLYYMLLSGGILVIGGVWGIICWKGICKKLLFLVVLISGGYFLLFSAYYSIDWENKKISWAKADRRVQKGIYQSNCNDLVKYIQVNKKLPLTLKEALLQGGNEENPRGENHVAYLMSCGTGESKVVNQFDGKGGWVYNPESGEFALNLEGMEDCSTNLIAYMEEWKKNTQS